MESPVGEGQASMGPSPDHERFHSRTSGNLQHRHKQPPLGGGNGGLERWCFRTANALDLQKWGHFSLLHRQALGQVLGEAEQGLVPVQTLPGRLLAQVS